MARRRAPARRGFRDEYRLTAEHWQAIKQQELFAHRVIPHFKAATRKKRQAVKA